RRQDSHAVGADGQGLALHHAGAPALPEPGRGRRDGARHPADCRRALALPGCPGHERQQRRRYRARRAGGSTVTEEQPSPAPSNGTPATPPPAEVPASRPTPARRAGGCLGRFISALLVVIITTFLALAIGAIGLLYLGFRPAMPQQLDAAQQQLETMQAQNISLQTQVAAHEQRGSTDHEVLGDLKRAVDDMSALRDQLRQERENSAIQSATLVADVRASRDSVALFATAEASRAALLAELERRSARVERFLQRLGDI